MKADVECDDARIAMRSAKLREFHAELQERVLRRLKDFEAELMGSLEARLNAFAETATMEMDARLSRPRNYNEIFKAIVNRVCQRLEIDSSTLFSKGRPMWITEPRQLAMYLCRVITGAPFERIGFFFARDHGTVMYSVRTIMDRCEAYPLFKAQVEEIETELRADFGVVETAVKKAA